MIGRRKEKIKEKEKEPTETPKNSQSERSTIAKIFSLTALECPEIIISLNSLTKGAEHDELAYRIVNMCLYTGVTYPLIKSVLRDEFIKNANGDPGSIMRGVSLASRITKEYLHRIGGGYLKEILGSFIQQVVENDKSMEIDPIKLPPNEDIDANKRELLEKVRVLVTHIVSPEMIHKMPVDVKVIVAYIGELANKYAPKQFYPLIGGFLLLRYISPALTSPAAYGLIQDNKLTDTSQRCLVLLTKVIQNLSNGVEFSQKENFMTCTNDYIKANIWKMEKYFQSVVSQSPDSPKIVNPDAASESDFAYFSKLFSSRAKDMIDMAEGDTLAQLQDLLTKIGQYKHMDVFLDRKYEKESSEMVLLRVTVETSSGSFERVVEMPAQQLQPHLQQLFGRVEKDIKKLPKKTIEPSNAVFGRPLDDLMAQQQLLKPDCKVPEFMQEAFHYLLLKLNHVGLFRVSGEQQAIQQLRQQIDRGDRPAFALSKMEPDTVAGVIKVFLKELPGGLIPSQFHDELLSQSPLPIERLRNIIFQLPKFNQHLLELLLRLLHLVTRNSNTNQMTSSNLGVAFGPSVFQSRSQSINQVSALNQVLEMAISQYEVIFREWIAMEEQNIRQPLLKMKLVGHSKSVSGIALIGPSIVCTSSAHVLRLHDIETLSFMRQLELTPQSGQILSLASANSQLWMATDRTLLTYDPSGDRITNLNLPPASTLCYCALTHTIWANTLDSVSLMVYDAARLRALHNIQLPVNNDSVTCLQAIGDKVWVGSITGSIYIFDARRYQLLSTIPNAHKRKVNSFCDAGDTVWSGSDDGGISTWSKSFQFLKRIETHSGKIKGISFWNNQVWACTWEMTIKIFDKNSLEMIREIKDLHSDAVNGVLFVSNKARSRHYAWTISYDSSSSVLLLPPAPERSERRGSQGANSFASSLSPKIGFRGGQISQPTVVLERDEI